MSDSEGSGGEDRGFFFSFLKGLFGKEGGRIGLGLKWVGKSLLDRKDWFAILILERHSAKYHESMPIISDLDSWYQVLVQRFSNPPLPPPSLYLLRSTLQYLISTSEVTIVVMEM